MSDEAQATHVADAGPDPVWGATVFVVGLLIMAIGGASTQHYMFNVGETILLVGAAMFLVSLAISSIKMRVGVSDDEQDAPDEVELRSRARRGIALGAVVALVGVVGKLVLRGTDSSLLLVAFGLVYVGVNVYHLKRIQPADGPGAASDVDRRAEQEPSPKPKKKKKKRRPKPSDESA